jgi:small conductance mechanosensitive channel
MTAVIGLAFQDMIKDFIAGIAIIVENQFSVGDTVIAQADGFKGTVTNIGLKTTEITNDKGEVKIMANHNIDGLINCSR